MYSMLDVVVIYSFEVDLQRAKEFLVAEQANSIMLQNRIQELEKAAGELSEQTEQQRKTISLLVSEKASLTESVERLEDAESRSLFEKFCMA